MAITQWPNDWCRQGSKRSLSGHRQHSNRVIWSIAVGSRSSPASDKQGGVDTGNDIDRARSSVEETGYS